ncbi:MAG: baseplate J/gp47 family protein [Anaerovoracaceae bacterium]
MSNAEKIRENISNDYEKTPGYLLFDLTEAIGIVMDNQENELMNIAQKLDVFNLSGEELDKYIFQRKGLKRKLATYSECVLSVIGNGIVSVGDLFETDNGIQFQSIENKEIINNGEVKVKAVLAGNNSMVGANSIIRMPVTITGLVSCNNSQATVGGYPEEEDRAYLNRYLQALRYPDSSGNKYSYEKWALEVTGVGGAVVFPLAKGPNTVDVVIIDANKLPASSSLVEEVQKYIDPESKGRGEGQAPIGARCYVSAAFNKSIIISCKLTISANQNDVESAIKEAIKGYLKSIAFKNKNVSYAQIGNCIIDTEGVIDYENLVVNGGTANIQVQSQEVATLNAAVFTYE